MKFWKYLSIGLMSLLVTVALYAGWQSVDADQILGMIFLALAWFMISVLVLLYQLWRNDPGDKPNPLGTRFQKKAFWRTLFLGPLYIVVLAAEGPPKHYRWPQKPLPK